MNKKKITFSVLILTIVMTTVNAGNPAAPVKVEWNKIFSKLSDYQLTGQSKQLPLAYSYDALIPVIDAKTVEIHYSKHHAAYTKNLNDAVAIADFKAKPLFRIFDDMDKYPVLIRNNGGGYYNHLLYWQIITPNTNSGQPTGNLLKAINEIFGDLDKFKQAEKLAVEIEQDLLSLKNDINIVKQKFDSEK